jgi:molybdopterin-synthase adenylyltransferase
MKAYRLKISEQTLKELQQLVFADLPKEAGAFALAGSAEHGNGIDITVRRAVPIPKNQFSTQHEFRLEISTQAINGLIALCESNKLGAVLCHSHPDNIPYSPTDDDGERRLFEILRQFIPPAAPIASVLFYPGGIRGRVWVANSPKPIPFSEMLVIGSHVKRIRLIPGESPEIEYPEEMFDRQVRAFGEAGQKIISATKVGIIGVGGTGSPTAEQLIRLGVRDLILVDPDEFDASNLSRVYGTFASSVAKDETKKVELVAAHLRRINPKAIIQAISASILSRDAAQQVLDRDVLFLCTDNHWSRSVVNQIAYQYLIPTINLGVRIDATDGRISDARGAVDVLRPGLPCLWCTQFLRAERIAAESMPRHDRLALEREGYVEGVDETAPSVVSMTTTISGTAVTLFLQLVTNFMGSGGDIARLNLNMMDGTVRRGRATLMSECICKKALGFGDMKALPVL